jgi:hypothetical protein
MALERALAKVRMKREYHISIDLNHHVFHFCEGHFALSKVTVDIVASLKHIHNRGLAAQHLPNLLPTALVLLDAVYSSLWLVMLILSRR